MSTTVVQTAGVMRAADVRALLGDPPPTFLIEEADMTRKRRAEVVDRMAAAYLLQAALDASRNQVGH